MSTDVGFRGYELARRVWNSARSTSKAIVLALILSSCKPSSSSLPPGGNWRTYANSRYGFEFLYPSKWVASQSPEDRDGQAFTLPENAAVEIRGWASNRYALPKNVSQSVQPNFRTHQGLAGQLKVEIGPKLSSMSLTLDRGQVRYNWQGQAPSQQFDNYYHFFNYIATEYRVSR